MVPGVLRDGQPGVLVGGRQAQPLPSASGTPDAHRRQIRSAAGHSQRLWKIRHDTLSGGAAPAFPSATRPTEYSPT
ncbi:hypothetical protein [Saccharothrix espanaensis]|uniref:hypothetical protein n=1 Tax=Saccharothrix espanaensis TaxID=103731 RepID=UPI00138E24B5|nr:hypothetical protein [Saccharothrix espanaensis]